MYIGFNPKSYIITSRATKRISYGNQLPFQSWGHRILPAVIEIKGVDIICNICVMLSSSIYQHGNWWYLQSYCGYCFSTTRAVYIGQHAWCHILQSTTTETHFMSPNIIGPRHQGWWVLSTWVLSAPDEPHVGPINIFIRGSLGPQHIPLNGCDGWDNIICTCMSDWYLLCEP